MWKKDNDGGGGGGGGTLLIETKILNTWKMKENIYDCKSNGCNK